MLYREPKLLKYARNAVITFENSDGTAAKTLLTMGSNGGLIESWFVTSTDTTEREMVIAVQQGSTTAIVDRISIPAATGSVPVVIVPLMNPGRWSWLDPYNIKWAVQANVVFTCQMVSAVSSGAKVSVVCNYGEF